LSLWAFLTPPLGCDFFVLIAVSDALNFGLNYVKARYTNQTAADAAEVVILCCAFKPMISFLNERVGTTCRERCGGAGFLSSNRLGQIMNFSHAGMTAEGDNRVLFQKVTKETLALLSKGKHKFPRIQRSKGDAPIDIATATLEDLLWLCVEREKLQFTGLAGEMQTKIGGGAKLFDVSVRVREAGKSTAINICAPHIVSLCCLLSRISWMLESSDQIQAAALSLGSRIALEQSMIVLANMKKKYTNGAQDQRTQAVLADLLSLYALRRIELDLPWFLIQRVLTLEQGAAVTERVRTLCAKIAPVSLALVKGFGIPDWLCMVR
jgi:acyl-CoA oxidase